MKIIKFIAIGSAIFDMNESKTIEKALPKRIPKHPAPGRHIGAPTYAFRVTKGNYIL